jgi:DNA-binding transcriptional LysR family regulator
MDMRQIEIFVAAMEHASLTEAARTLGVTQPAVSAALAKLEREVNFPLFRRDGRRLTPTPEARQLRDQAVQVMAGFSQLTEAACGISAARRGALTVASSPSPGIAWLPSIVAGFRRDRPDVTVRLLTRSSREVRDLVSTYVFDLGVAEPPFDRTDVILRRYRFAVVAVLPAGHPLCAHEVITPRLLDGQDLVTSSPGGGTHASMSRAFEAAGAQRRVVAECEFFASAINLAAAGGGVCLVDPISAAASASPHIALRRFEPAVLYEVALLRPAGGELTRLATAFAAAFDAHVAPFVQTVEKP